MRERGFSIIEILIVILIFAVIGIISTRAIILSLSSARKADSLTSVRENTSYIMSVIERRIRNAQAIRSCTNTSVDYLSADDEEESISCTEGTNGVVRVTDSSGTNRISSDIISIVRCDVVCSAAEPGIPAAVDITIEAERKGATGTEKSTVVTGSKIYTRAY